MKQHKLFIGTSGYNYKEWKELFYPTTMPPREWLAYFATRFDTVEINNSFYTSVKRETYEKWYEATPKDFSFVIKGHRYITHRKRLIDVEESLELFFSNASGLKEKLSCVLWQFPANFTLRKQKDKYLERLEEFLKLLPKNLRHAFEFRDESFFESDVVSLLRLYGASIVISQSGVFPERELLNETFVYIRFHGPTSLYSSKYTDEQLFAWAQKIKKYLLTQDVYCYFNNDMSGYAIQNTQKLQQFIGEYF